MDLEFKHLAWSFVMRLRFVVIFLLFCDQAFLTVVADNGDQDQLYVVEMGDAKWALFSSYFLLLDTLTNLNI